MDFGDVVSLSAATSLAANETRDQEKLYGSDGVFFFKQEFLSRGRTNSEGDLRGLKLPKTESFDDFSASKAIIQRNSLLRSDSFDSHGSSQMLCFSSPNSVTFPFYHHPSSNTTTYARNAAAYGSKGSFTPSQWMELEHQALIYKYIHANVPIPTSLLTPIRKTLDSAGFSAFVGLRPSSYGWGAYQLGFSNSTDPEPGRCRRTDGKKWRCARDALADHKYCDRHMNRGRHRSRKPVEGQSGHSVSGTTNSTTTIKQMPPMASSTSATVVPRGAAFDNLGLKTSQHLCNTPSGVASQSSASGPGNRSFMDNDNLGGKYQDITGLSMISPSLSLKDNQYSIPKPQDANRELCRGEFGQVCSDSLLNPFNKSSSLVNCSSYGTSEESKDTKSKPQNSLHQFFTDWPNNQSESSWQDINMHSERTQLSISIPSAISDFMSSTSSPTNEKLVSSPPKHSQDLEATQMRLQVGNIPNDRSHRKEANWIPVNWESSMEGGPLAEVLNNTHSNSVDSKTPSLNLMTGGWDSSPYFASSPTGVLQKASFVSSSNSSAGSSPRAAAADISKAHKGASLCSNVLISSLTNPVLPNL